MKFLLATVSLVALCGTAYAGGDDHFGGSETSAHSSFGGTTGYGGSTSMSSAQDGYGGFTVDRLAQDDYTDSYGRHVVDTYTVDTWRGTATLVSHDVESGYDTYRVSDETVRGGFRMERVPVERPGTTTISAQTETAATTTTTTTTAGPTSTDVSSSSTDLGSVGSSSLAGPSETAQPAQEQRSIVDVQGPTTTAIGERLPGPVAYQDRRRATYATLERSLDALEQAMVDRRPGQALRTTERTMAALTNMGAFGALGALTGGVVRGRTGAITGAIEGAMFAEFRRQRSGVTPFDSEVRDALTIDQEEFDAMASRVRGMSPSQIDRFNRELADLRTAEGRRAEREEREDRTDRPGREHQSRLAGGARSSLHGGRQGRQ